MKSLQEILLSVKKTLQIEGESVLALQKYINKATFEAVNEIFIMKGRLIVTGVGKSALIAQKLVATFNSTGTPSAFLHAGDAIHGDLGMVLPQDVVLCLSQSGNTPEIKVLLPILKARTNKIIAIVGNTESYLAKNADHVLYSIVEKEACPLNLAPTSSSTAQLALGDALAVALMELRDFSIEEFGKSHPGGALGRRIYLKISDLFLKNTKQWVNPNANFKTIISSITQSFVGATAVISNNKIIGIITDGDIRRSLEKELPVFELIATDLMTAEPKTISADALAFDAMQLMKKTGVSQLIVVDNDIFLGFLHLHDLLREGIV